MRINFLVNPVFNGWEPTDTRLGGTERAVVEWGEELVKRGHGVRVYYNSKNPDLMGFTDPDSGVVWMNRRYYPDDEKVDICINIKSHDIKRGKYPMLYYTNETNASELDLSTYDGVIHISQYAKDNIPVNNDNVFIVPHGYDDSQIYPGEKIPKQCLYASSPDRGLETLLEVWPKVYEAHPDATLIVTYNGTGPNLPGVMYMGDCTEEEMAELYRTSDIWCHPCNGGELYCITGIKAQAAGCIPVIIPTMALAETVKTGYFATKETYGEVLTNVLGFDYEFASKHRRGSAEGMPTIADSTDELLKAIEKCYNKA